MVRKLFSFIEKLMDRKPVMLALLLVAFSSLFTYKMVDNVKDKSADVMEDVRQSVYSVEHEYGRGTGWVTTTKSGRKVIVTNIHVCSNPTPFMHTTKNGVSTVLTVIAKDSEHDICILTAPKEGVPLKLAKDVEPEDTVYAVGFPIIDFMTSSRGLVKGYNRIQIPWESQLEPCTGKKLHEGKYLQRLPNGKISVVSVCVFEANMLVTTIVTDAGASGSPILDEDEHVVGMVMVAAGHIPWAQGVPLAALKKFLDKY